ncbi:MAG: PAS domain-containing protein [Bradymonadaceae bacterium]|nr:PAS domain-containing protein [Lujinxingiaceae bacterium]
MTLSFRSKLFLIAVSLLMTFAIASGLYLERELRNWFESRIETELQAHAQTAREAVTALPADASPEAIASLAERLGTATATRVTLIGADGRVLGDSHLPGDALHSAENHAARPEIAAAQTQTFGSARRLSRTVGKHMFYVAVPYTRDDVRGVVRVGLPLDDIDEVIAHLRLFMVFAILFGLVAAMFLSGVASHLMARTLRELVQHARTVTLRPSPLASDEPAAGLANSMLTLREELGQTLATMASERDRFEAVLDGMGEAVIAVSPDRRMTLVNRAARALFGLSTPPVGRKLDEIPDLAMLDDLVVRTEHEQSASAEFDLAGPVVRKVMARATVKRASGGTIIVIHDVTELRRLETIRRDFIANVSHELRTPVSVVQANAETLLDGALEDGEMARAFVEAIHRNSERLSRLIADLLDISRLEADKYEIELQPVALAVAVHRAIDAVEGKIDRALTAIDLAIDDQLVVWADPKAIDQVLFNLLDNAFKHMPDGGRVKVVAELGADEVRIEIRDDGPGIDFKHRDRIFERFYRVDKGRASHMGGTGLGLSIVKHLVSTMGGNVGFRPNSPRGSIFWFTLCREQPDTDAAARP